MVYISTRGSPAQQTTAKIKIEAHKNKRRKLKLTFLVRAVHAGEE